MACKYQTSNLIDTCIEYIIAIASKSSSYNGESRSIKNRSCQLENCSRKLYLTYSNQRM